MLLEQPACLDNPIDIRESVNIIYLLKTGNGEVNRGKNLCRRKIRFFSLASNYLVDLAITTEEVYILEMVIIL